jgi:hypothetical protein
MMDQSWMGTIKPDVQWNAPSEELSSTLAFCPPSSFRLPKGLGDHTHAEPIKKITDVQKALVSLINGLSQEQVSEGCQFIVDEDQKTAILFDTDATEEWLSALEGQDHITDVFVVVENKKQFEVIKGRVEDLLGNLTAGRREGPNGLRL